MKTDYGVAVRAGVNLENGATLIIDADTARPGYDTGVPFVFVDESGGLLTEVPLHMYEFVHQCEPKVVWSPIAQRHPDHGCTVIV